MLIKLAKRVEQSQEPDSEIDYLTAKIVWQLRTDTPMPRRMRGLAYTASYDAAKRLRPKNCRLELKGPDENGRWRARAILKGKDIGVTGEGVDEAHAVLAAYLRAMAAF